MVFQFKIQLKGVTKPPVWRKVAVPADFTFFDFHVVIQIAFGWCDAHLFEFRDKEYQSNVRITTPPDDDFFDADFFDDVLVDSEVELSDIFAHKYRKFFYIYDFGDRWVHEITLESTTEDEQKEAVCLSGKGACPPEDCGGIYGYEMMKDVFKTNPEGEQAAEYREWLGLEEDEIWDVNEFDINEVNDELKHIFLLESDSKHPIELIKNIASEIDLGMDCYLNLKTLEIASVPGDTYSSYDEDDELWQETRDIISSWNSYIRFEPLTPASSFKIMEDFVASCIPDDDTIKSRLLDALSKAKPFQNFKFIIDNSQYRQDWFDFKQTQLEQHVLIELSARIEEGFEE